MDRKEIWKKVEIGAAFGNMTPSDLDYDCIIRIHSWYDPINRDERYRDHDKARCFYINHLEKNSVPRTVAWIDGYAGNTMNVSMKHLRAWCHGYLSEMMVAEDAVRKTAEEQAKMKKILEATAKIAAKLPLQIALLSMQLAKLGYSGGESFCLENNTLVITKLGWDSSNSCCHWDDVTSCSMPKVDGFTNKVTDFHVRTSTVYSIRGTTIARIGTELEKKLFRTTDKGVVSEQYSSKVRRIEFTGNIIRITYSDNETIFFKI